MWTARVHKYRQVLNYRKNDDNPSPLVALLANTGFLFKKAGKLPDGIISVIKISYKFIKSWAMMILGKFKGKVWWTTGTSNSRKSLDGKTVRIFAYSRTREQSNERSGTKLKTESSPHRPYGRVRLARLALKTLTLRLTDSFTDFEKKTDCFAV